MLAWLQTLGALSVASSLVTAPAVPPSAPQAPTEQPAEPVDDDSEPTEPKPAASDNKAAIEAAEAAWNRGDFLEVRGLLEPIADSDPLTARVEREKVLVLLADATLSDATLPGDERQVRVRGHLNRLMDQNARWRLPRKVYSPELYDLYLDVREQRLSEAGSQCEADKLACEADADAVGAQLDDTQQDLAALQKKYDAQEVAVGEKRTRGLALFPLGISHFLNGDRAFGAAFLAAEAAIGIAGLSLLVVRTTVDGCDRTANFQSGSLVCKPRRGTSENDVVRRRKAEETMAWMFVGTVAFDILIAQLRFKEFEITDSVPRSELENETRSARRKRRRTRKPRATVEPKASGSPEGASLGLRVRF